MPIGKSGFLKCKGEALDAGTEVEEETQIEMKENEEQEATTKNLLDKELEEEDRGIERKVVLGGEARGADEEEEKEGEKLSTFLKGKGLTCVLSP